MNNEEIQLKQEQYNEFFSIEDEFSVNITPLDKNLNIDYQYFINQIPTPFKMATDISVLDQAALRPLQALSGIAGQLVEYLNHQAQKIDLLMSYILDQQNEEDSRYIGKSFGGAGITFISDESYAVEDLVEMKVFIQSSNCAVFCYGEIIDVISEDEKFTHKVLFHFIQDEDRETLVRASLHKQSEQLKLLSKKRKKTAEK